MNDIEIVIDTLIIDSLHKQQKSQEERPFLQLEIEDDYYRHQKNKKENETEPKRVIVIDI